jgi:hypothetical protein
MLKNIIVKFHLFKNKAKESKFYLKNTFIKVDFKKIKNQVTESLILKKEIYIKELGKKIKWQGEDRLHQFKVTFTRGK